jgi:hypothetical protein
MFRINLRHLILWISLLSVVLALMGSLHASYLVQRDLLLRTALELNQAYASKLASVTDVFLTDLRNYLSYSAEMLADLEVHPEHMVAETQRQERQLGQFNSTFVVSPQGRVLAASTSDRALLGQQLNSEAVRRAQATLLPTVSPAFLDLKNRWLILYTHPIFSADHRYLGFLGGTLYLHEPALLRRRLLSLRHRSQRHPDLSPRPRPVGTKRLQIRRVRARLARRNR